MTDSAAAGRWALTLYVDGASTSSVHAIERVRRICDEELEGQADLQVINIRAQPALAGRDQIVAAPTLIRRSPRPQSRIVGDFSDSSLLRFCLGLAEVSGQDHERDD